MHCSAEWWARADLRISSRKTALLYTAHVFCPWSVVSVHGVLYWDGGEVWGPATEARGYGTWKVLGQEWASTRVLVDTTWEHVTQNVLSQHLIYQAEVSAKQCYTLQQKSLRLSGTTVRTVNAEELFENSQLPDGDFHLCIVLTLIL